MLRQRVVLMALCLSMFAHPAMAEEELLYPGFPSIKESDAYQKLRTRPATDHSKLLYLIDRYEDSDIKIRYNGYLFDSGFSAYVARWFLSRQYRGETPKEWVVKYCDKSLIKEEPIWVKLPNGEFAQSKPVLFAEIEALEAVLIDEPLETVFPGKLPK